MNIIPSSIRRRIAHRPNLVKIVDNIGWLFFDKILRMGVGLLVGVWVARYLGPEQFGALNFASAFTGLFGAIASLGLPSIVVRDIVRDPDTKASTLGAAALLHLIGGVIAYALCLAAIFIMRPEDSLGKTLVAIIGAMMLFKASDIAVYWFESQVQSKYVVWVQNGVFLLFACIKVSLILTNASLVMFAWATLSETLLVSVLLLVVMNQYGSNLIDLSVYWERIRLLLKDGWPLLLSSIAVTIYMKIDQVMLGQMVGDEAVGIYSAAVRVSEIWYFIPTGIIASVSPSMIETKQRSEKEYYARLQKLFNLMFALSVTVALPVIFLATPIVEVLFGNGFSASGDVLAINIWSSMFVFWGVASSNWFLTENRQVLAMQRTVLGAVTNISLNLWLIPFYGVIGAAIATVASQAVAAWLFDLLQVSTRHLFFMKLASLNLFRYLIPS